MYAVGLGHLAGSSPKLAVGDLGQLTVRLRISDSKLKSLYGFLD